MASLLQSFETITCGRCGGTGHYSYCQRFGTTCFKCAGRKIVYTKRGHAAKLFYEAQLSKPACEVTVGELIYIQPGPFNSGGFSTVTAVTPDTTLYNGAVREDYICIVTAKMTQHISRESVIRMGATAERKTEVLKAALAYQASLTKLGKPRKQATQEVR